MVMFQAGLRREHAKPDRGRAMGRAIPCLSMGLPWDLERCVIVVISRTAKPKTHGLFLAPWGPTKLERSEGSKTRRNRPHAQKPSECEESKKQRVAQGLAERCSAGPQAASLLHVLDAGQCALTLTPSEREELGICFFAAL